MTGGAHRYAFAALLALRERAERSAEEALASATAARARAEAVRADAEEALASHRRRRLAGGALPVARSEDLQRAGVLAARLAAESEELSAELERCRAAVVLADREVGRAREELLGARRARDVIARHFDRWREERRRAAAAAEEDRIADAAAAHRARRRR